MNRLFQSILFLLFCITVCDAAPVQIDFFYEPGCHSCEQIEQDLFPELEKRFPGRYEITAHDIGIKTNFILLLQTEDSLGYEASDRAYLVVNQQHIFGANPSPEEFLNLISQLLSQSDTAGSTAKPGTDSAGLIQKRFTGFTVCTVLTAGLIDGINPCAISTLVFFMSLLAVSKIRKQQLLLLGISFCLASFLTYLALGFGLFRALHLFSGFTVLRTVIERSMAAVLLVLAALSFRDAVRFRKTGCTADVTLQLSATMKKRIHEVMRRGLKSPHLFLAGLFIGTLVTALESVCTGQVYVPTLILILKKSAFSEPRAWLLLLLYNLLFILPLVTVFIAVYFGLQTGVLLSWSRRHVTRSKILLGLLFILLAALMV